jgi:hypothetical protein
MRFNISRFFGKIRTKHVIFFILAILILFVIYKYFSFKEGLASNEEHEEGLPPGVTYEGLYKLTHFPQAFQDSYNYVVKNVNKVVKDGHEPRQNRWNMCVNHGRCGGNLLGLVRHLGGGPDGKGGIYDTGCVYYAVSGPDNIESFYKIESSDGNASSGKKGFSIFHNFNNKDNYTFDSTILKGMKKYESVEGKNYKNVKDIDSIPDGYVAFFSSEKEDKCPGKSNSNSKTSSNEEEGHEDGEEGEGEEGEDEDVEVGETPGANQ